MVHTAIDKRTNATVVVKVIKSEYLLINLNNRARVEGEMYAMENLNHEYIVKMYEQGMKGVMLTPTGTIE